ncbi:hypothetical protein [Mycolicibacterium porcinum]|uniref:hypothetical protein n=1 Tax=Mycolicibacterium porcinum TaxID=39693 RepID=UPI001041F290|nr:hypothetical protein [Mycolicibacterium porcinum]
MARFQRKLAIFFTFDDGKARQGNECRPLAQSFVAVSGVGAGDSVLDVGCGPGPFTVSATAWAARGRV